MLKIKKNAGKRIANTILSLSNKSDHEKNTIQWFGKLMTVTCIMACGLISHIAACDLNI